jgi:hypothetical protein
LSASRPDATIAAHLPDKRAMLGQTLSHYRIVEKIGEGAMGLLYRARDTRLDRDVAIKVLRPEVLGDVSRRQRLLREAKAASALNHPHIVAVHEIGQAALDGQEMDFIVMECVPGRGLDQVIVERRLSVDEALDIALQITGALAAAHGAGIVHRDVKPANIMVSDTGKVTVLDFGLAKAARETGAGATASGGASTASTEPLSTRPGARVGTPAYMSPEQAEGRPTDARSDVFGAGVVLYEMLAGRRPFRGGSDLSVLTSILRDTPPPLRSVRPEVPRDLQRVVDRCLVKDADGRYASAAQLRLDLVACQARLLARASGWRAVVRQPRVWVPLAAVALAAIGSLGWTWMRGAPARRARAVALPEIARIAAADDPAPTEIQKAYWLAREAKPHLPGDSELERFWRERCYPVALRTDPPGAEVFVKAFADPDGEWKSMGRSPLEGIRVPYQPLRWRITKEGFETVYASSSPAVAFRSLAFRLDPVGTVPAGMVRIGGARFDLRSFPPVELDDFWLDRHEVTNRQFKEFVDSGGYRTQEYWTHPFVKDGRRLTWRDAVARFVDATGRPGPATWEAGTYPADQGDFPVGGVSWYEAAAFAAFAGKELPTFYHWVYTLVQSPEMVALSHFGGAGPVAVGTLGGMSRYGNFDMAGNVREWSSTESAGGRYALGGAWTDPPRAYLIDNVQSPWIREAENGFRCARYAGPLASHLTAAVEVPRPDYSRQTPVSDETFAAYRSFYAYDRLDPKGRVDSVEETPRWRRERVSFEAAHGGERVIAHLFLPRGTRPPYQAVMYSPTIEAFYFRSSDEIRTAPFEYIVRSGRAVVHPVYFGTYERYLRKPVSGLSDVREIVTQSIKDLRRGLDYLESRPDFDHGRVAMLGISDSLSVIAPAVDGRLKATVIQGGGLVDLGRPPETDPFHFAPRVRVPALVLAGRHDPLPGTFRGVRLLELLGSPPTHKRLVYVESGHSMRRSPEVVKETLDWLDRHLGPVPAPR